MMRKKIMWIALFLSWINFLMITAHAQDKFQKLDILADTIISAPGLEKGLAWNKFWNEFYHEFYHENDRGKPDAQNQYLISYFIENIILKAPEPYKSLAWARVIEENMVNYNDVFLLRNIIMKNAPEPYKIFAWNALANSEKFNDSLLMLIISAPEPYASWAWQAFISTGSKNINLNNDLATIINTARGPHAQWAWEKLLISQPAIKLFYSLLMNASEPYAGFAWGIINQHKPEEIKENEINLLKNLANSGRFRYQKLATTRILSLPSLSSEDREVAIKLYKTFFSVDENTPVIAYAYTLFKIEKNNQDNP